MIFTLRIFVFSFLILLGFQFSVLSRNLRKVISLIYGCVLVWYTFLCRIRLSVEVSASDYGHTLTTSKSVAEKIWSIIKAIFGMDASGHLAGIYWQAVVLNVLLFVPLGYLVLLHFLYGDGDTASSEEGKAGEATDKATTERSVEKSCVKKSISAILICIAVSICIELLQGLTGLGMTDINDVIANALGGSMGVAMVWSYLHRLRRGRA